MNNLFSKAPGSMKVKFLLICLFLFNGTKTSTAQSMQWVNTLIGNNYNTSVNIVSDNSGDIYQTGRFISLVDFNTGAGIDTMNAGSANGNPTSRAAYISRTNTVGNHVWAKSFIPHNNDGESIAVSLDLDHNGHVLALGQFQGTVDFDPGPAFDTLSTYPLNEMSYITKLDGNGSYLWAKKIETIALPGSNTVYAVKAGASNSIYIYGIFTGTIDFDFGPGVNNVTAATISNYLLKLDSNGDLMWVKTWDNSSFNANNGGNRIMAIDPNDNIYLCLGYPLTDTLDVDPGPLVNDLIGRSFLVKIDSSGNLIWGGACTASSMQVHLDKFGALYTTGSFALGADVDPGPGNFIPNGDGDVYLTKSNANGNLLWVKKFEDINVQHLTTDTAGNIFYAWSSGSGAVDCDPDTSRYIIRGGNSRYIICGLDSSGAFKWAKKASWGNLCNNIGVRLNVTAANDLMITGRFCHVLDIDFSPAVYNIGQNSALSCFLMKYNYCGNTGNYFYASCDSVVLPDTTYHQTVDYVNEYLDVNNCDSNVNIHVNVLAQQNEFVINACDSVNYFGQIYTQSGTYTQIVPNAIGCDSVHTLHININTPAGLPPFLNQIQTFQPYHPAFPASSYITSYNIEVDSLFNMYLSGSFGNSIDFNPLGTPYLDTSWAAYYQNDGFVTRYDSSGLLQWMHQLYTIDAWGAEVTPSLCLNDGLELYSSTYGTSGSNIGMNKLSQFAYANTYYGSTQMGNYTILNVNQILNDPTSNLPVKIGFHDSIPGFQYAYKKMVVWRGNNMATFATGGQYIGLNGAVDSQGNIYVVSSMQPIYNGVTYCMIAKLDSNLNMLWNKQIGEGSAVPPFRTLIDQLKVDTNGSLLLCGRFMDTLDIDISPNTYNLVSNGDYDAFIARFDTSANFIWAHSFGGVDDDYANTITTDLSGRIYLGGSFSSPSVDLDPTAGISFLLKGCVNADWQGGFISKFKPDGTFMNTMGSGERITELEFKAPKRIYATGFPFVQVFEIGNDIIVNISDTICAGDSVIVGNSVYYQTGVYTAIFPLAPAVDSIVITNLTVSALPLVLANATDSVLCLGDSVVLFGSGANTYVWNNLVIDSVIFSPIATSNYLVTGTDINGCVNTDSITVVVNALPIVTANASDTLICYGDSILLFGSGALTYVWNNLVIDSMIFAPNITNNYIVTGTDTNACVNTDSITVVVNPLPNVIANASDTSVCVGNPVTLFGTGADSFSWTNAVIDSVAFYPLDTVMYVVTGIDINGCIGQDSILIQANQIPFPILVFSGDTLYCTNVTGVNIYWYKDTVAVDSLVNYYVVTQNGNYEVFVVDSNGCAGADSISMLNVSYQTSIKSELIQVYPNPTQGAINIAFDLKQPGDVELMINDLLGKKVYSSSRKIPYSGSQLLSINLEAFHLKTGMYFLHIILDGKHHVLKVEYLR